MGAITKIRWGRVVLAAVLAEAAVILLLLAVVTVYSVVISPGLTTDEYDVFGQDAGYYVAPAAAAGATFLMVLWVARALDSGFVANGLMVGLVGVLLTVGFVFGARPEDRLMYGVSFALRIVGGYAGGIVAQRLRGRPSSARRPV